MIAMIDWLVLAVTLPLLGAAGAAALPGSAHRVGILAAVTTTLAALAAAHAGLGATPVRSTLGGWEAPLGIALQVDALSAVLLVMANLVALGISLSALEEDTTNAERRHFWPLWLLMWTAINGVLLSADLFNIYVTLELLGLTAAALGALSRQPAAVRANLRYLLVGLLGSMTYLLGVALLYTGTGTLDLGLVADRLEPGPLAGVSFALLIGGLLLKCALFPLHFWLPPAHSAAPAPVSAALSALVVKVAFYLVLRLWLDLFGPITAPPAAHLLGALGAAAVLWGSWNAMRAERLKPLAAYSTVSQIGYLFLFLPLIAATEGPRQDVLIGALVLLALTHGFAKASLFLGAGLLKRHAGHDRIDALGPAMRALPVVAFAIGLSGIALIGLPPSGTFLAKWILLEESLIGGQWWWAGVIVAGTLMASAYVFRLVGCAFDAVDAVSTKHQPSRCVTTQVVTLVLGLMATLALGLGAEHLWILLGEHAR